MELPSSSSQPNNNEGDNISNIHSIPNLSNPSSKDPSKNVESIIFNNKKKKKKKTLLKLAFPVSSSTAATASSSKGLRVMSKLSKNASKVIVNRCGSDFDGLALPLGMSIAAVVAQICTSAVKESLANVYGDRFDRFVRNFGESFRCTLKTLRIVNEASLNNREPVGHPNIESLNSEASSSTFLDDRSSSVFKPSVCQSASLDGHRHEPSSVPEVNSTYFGISKSLDCVEDLQENVRLDAMNRELTLHGEMNQMLACVTERKSDFGMNGSMLNTFEKSVMEQARSNDLKTFEIGLLMKRLQLEESKLSLSSDSNRLERFKLSMGISKASFKVEKFKTQLEETRHTEFHKKCIDCLVAGLLIMSASLLYAAYVYSYKRISEFATSCITTEDSRSWWMPKRVQSLNSGMQNLKCLVIVASRMLFGVVMILAIAYLLLLRSSTSNQSMPVTHILLLLGVVCGFVGKLCVDTLGGSGYNWLLHWEALCLLHFFANICISTFFTILYGPVSVSQGFETKERLPYWIRRYTFFAVVLFFLPLLCGMMPFASPSDWKDHFVSIAKDAFFGSVIVEGR
ncbi:hypothetical protein IFM89_039314 [Coptis chinensis]|uniref:Protein CPR-5 n=1 Tax=Coptis chinensis TaxID=261450 RepID=A0A835HQL1_9MAGN|nr:hypothetical protein IFM89_039314 [Coptis chinensis]